MQELMMYVNTLIKIAEIDYGYKTCLSYNNGTWYSREHSRELSVEEVCEYVLGIVKHYDSLLGEIE